MDLACIEVAWGWRVLSCLSELERAAIRLCTRLLLRHSRKGLRGKSAVGRLGCLSVSLLHLSSYMTGHWHEWILAWCALAFHSAETVVIESRRHLDL